MTEYTAHVQVPDAALGAVIHEVLLGDEAVECCTMRSGSGTWLSFGVGSDSDSEATMAVATVRYHASRATVTVVPDGYELDSLLSFENSPMIITCGRVVIHSEGI